MAGLNKRWKEGNEIAGSYFYFFCGCSVSLYLSDRHIINAHTSLMRDDQLHMLPSTHSSSSVWRMFGHCWLWLLKKVIFISKGGQTRLNIISFWKWNIWGYFSSVELSYISGRWLGRIDFVSMKPSLSMWKISSLKGVIFCTYTAYCKIFEGC